MLPCLLPGTRPLGHTSHASRLWVLSVHFCPSPAPSMKDPQPHLTHMYPHTCLLALQGGRAVSRWERLQGGEGEPAGGVWKLIFPPQKPQSRRDKALNPQGPLGGAQRYTQLARSPPRESRSRCPVPHPPATARSRMPVGPGMETLRGDFQAQRDQVSGQCCP